MGVLVFRWSRHGFYRDDPSVIEVTHGPHIRSYSEFTMRSKRFSIPLHVHGALEVLAAPLLIVAPFVFSFGQVGGAISIALGAVLVGLAISIQDERGVIPLRAHAELDYTIATVTIVSGIVLGLVTGNPVVTAFMVGFGALHLALTASTRFSRPLGI
jgi:hypothetical protein